jgi:maleylacetate reductase
MGQPGQDASEVLDHFIRNLGMPRSLREVKVAPDDFDSIAKAAMHTPWVPRNPRKIYGPAEVRAILELAA